MWVKDTYIKLVKDKTAYLAIRKAVQARQGRQLSKDAITAQCDRLLKGNRSNTYDEYLELVDKLINRFRKSNWVERAFDNLMLDDIALDSFNRYNGTIPPPVSWSSLIDSHLARLGLSSQGTGSVSMSCLEKLITAELYYINPKQSEQKQSALDLLLGDKDAKKHIIEVTEEYLSRSAPISMLRQTICRQLNRLGYTPTTVEVKETIIEFKNYVKGHSLSLEKQSVVDELYGKFMNEDKGATTLVEVFYRCNSRQDFTDQVKHRCSRKYKEDISYPHLDLLVEKLRKYCITQPEPTRNKSELVLDAMDLIMNDTPTRNNLLRLCRKHHERRLSGKYLFNSVRNALGIFNFVARDIVIHCVVRRLLAHSKRSGRGERLPTNRNEANSLAMDILKGREWSDKDKETLRNREHTIGVDFAEVEQRLVASTMKVSKEELGRMFGQASPKLKEENKMLGKIKVVTYVDGNDVNDLSNDQIFGKIRDLENQASSLGEIKVKSLALDKQVKEINKAIKGLVKLVDAR